MAAETTVETTIRSNPVQRVIQALRGIPPSTTPQYSLTRWVFLRLLGLIYFYTFASLWTQITGLIGSNGISPISDYLSLVRESLGSEAVSRLPTLVWLNSSDAFLNMLCGVGVVLSILVIFDTLTLPALIGLWALYLSMFYAGQNFLSFQWDILLIEVGFLAIFLAPLYPLPRISRQGIPSRTVIWLFRLLMFKLMLESSYVKLASGDPNWRDLTAMTFHYWTQPLPTPLAWYMNQLPVAFHQLETLVTFFVEGIVPFLIFGPRRVRIFAALLIAGHQMLIMLTGNYTFFNMLTIALCVPLLDDAFLLRLLPRRARESLLASVTLPRRPTTIPMYHRIFYGALAVLLVTLNLIQMGEQMLPGGVPRVASVFAQQFIPFRIVNGYGLFATMTTTRPEIIVEGSNDGQNWLPYEFKAKAGDLSRPPVWVAPHQPRLDWQMWFAALEGTPYAEGWFPTFAQRLLQGSPEVLALLDKNPFPDKPPRFIRAQLYSYHFTDAAERQ
jgi:lipase maturation factor 1